MAHYAYLDENNTVISIIVGKDENDPPGNWEEYYGAKRTSYNTRFGIYYNPETGEPDADQSKAFRKNYASIGGTYDPVLDAFLPVKPFPSWTLNTTSFVWDPPFPPPNDGKKYRWDEETKSWIEIQ